MNRERKASFKTWIAIRICERHHLSQKSVESYRSSVLSRPKCQYAIKLRVVRKSTVSDTHSYCVICNCDFSIGHGGIGDIAKHVQSAKHVAKVGSSAPLRKVEHFFADSKNLNVMRAEALFTEFIVEHTIPLACADHAGLLFRKMFLGMMVTSFFL